MKTQKPIKISHGRKKRRRLRKGRLALAGVFILLFGALIITVAGKAIKKVTSSNKPPLPPITIGDVSATPSAQPQPQLYEIDGRINVLVMGVDSPNPGKEKDGVYYPRSDTMMVMSIDTKTNSAFMLAIPRDIKITIGGESGKLNAVYRRGGPELAKKAVEQIVGIKLNKYMVISYQAVVKTIDDIGGIEFDVPMHMNYDDEVIVPPLHIHLKKGLQLLDGDKAMQLLRFREGYKDKDLGRLRMQQAFLKEVFKKVFSPSSVVHIPSYIDTLIQYVYTDLNVIDMLTYAHYAQKLSVEDIQRQTLAGDWNSKTLRFEIDEEKAVQQIQYLLSGNYAKKETAKPSAIATTIGSTAAPMKAASAANEEHPPAPPSEAKTATAKTDHVHALPPASADAKQTPGGENRILLENYVPEKTPVIYIDNGGGKTGSARRAADLLKINHLLVKAIGNAKEMTHQKTIIYYKDDERLAHKIQMLLEVGEVQQAASISEKKGYTIYVLIGKDFQK